MDDAGIIALYWARDEAAIAESDAAYGGWCRAVAGRLLADRRDCDECVNDTWLRAWGAMPPHWPECLRAFFAKITRRLALDRLRGANAAKRGSGEAAAAIEELAACLPSGEDVEELAVTDAMREAVDRFLASLGERERDIFLRRYFFCDTPAEIARRYALRRGNVNVILSRTRAALRAFLESEGWI